MPDQTFLDWPFFTDSHRKFAISLDDWCHSNLSDLPHGDVDQTCRALVTQLGAGGWLEHAAIDPNNADSRLDVRLLCLARETLARHHGLADFAFAMQGLGSGAIGLFGQAHTQRNYLPDVRSGKKIAAFALSEPNAGSDVAAMTTTAHKDGDEFVINGTKTWISNGGIADFYVVFARTAESGGSQGISAFLVDADSPGLNADERIDVIAPHPLATLQFSDCRVSADKLLGEPGKGFKVAMSVLDIFRSTVGAAALGFARRALDEATAHAKSREMFGKTLADLDITIEKLAEMALDVDASALLIYRAAWTKDCAQDRVTREAAMAKLYATESAQQVIDKAVQMFGGKGVESGHIVESLYREIRALRIYEGASEVQKLIIGRQVVG